MIINGVFTFDEETKNINFGLYFDCEKSDNEKDCLDHITYFLAKIAPNNKDALKVFLQSLYVNNKEQYDKFVEFTSKANPVVRPSQVMKQLSQQQ